MKQTLYLGLDPSNYQGRDEVTHFPVIEIVPRCSDTPEINAMFKSLESYTHIIFTSKTAVDLFFTYFKQRRLDRDVLREKTILAVGSATATHLRARNVKVDAIPEEERQEGLIDLLDHMDLSSANILLPRSAIARPNLTHYLVEKGIRHQVCILYDTFAKRPKELPDLRKFDQVIFTSPSTVDAFFSLFRKLPSTVSPIPIGPVTQMSLKAHLK